jgi:Vacuolar protein sorting-associated protein 62
MPNPPIQVIRASAKSGDEAKGEPTLLVSTTSNYSWLYSDSGSGAHMDVTVYRPTPTDTSYSTLGDYAQGNYSSPIGSSLIVKALNDDPKNPLLVAPTSYTEVWNDHGSGGHNDGSIWYPVPPDGYRSIGFVCAGGYNAPLIPSYRCVRKDLTADAQVGSLIWNDQGSGAHMDVALYQIVGVSSAFVAQGNYNPYSGNCYKLIIAS